eukprot:130536-Chlamydomonas_euryale.AAC.3
MSGTSVQGRHNSRGRRAAEAADAAARRAGHDVTRGCAAPPKNVPRPEGRAGGGGTRGTAGCRQSARGCVLGQILQAITAGRLRRLRREPNGDAGATARRTSVRVGAPGRTGRCWNSLSTASSEWAPGGAQGPSFPARAAVALRLAPALGVATPSCAQDLAARGMPMQPSWEDTRIHTRTQTCVQHVPCCGTSQAGADRIYSTSRNLDDLEYGYTQSPPPFALCCMHMHTHMHMHTPCTGTHNQCSARALPGTSCSELVDHPVGPGP